MQVLDKKRLGLYIHVPFCRSKCAYCDFYSFVPQDDSVYERYVSAVIAHMENYKVGCATYTPDTVFIGGGTPTSLPADQLLRLISGIKKNFDIQKGAEFTVEANPATVTYKDLKRLRRAGVNRLSIGLQSADNGELHTMSRIHSRSDFEEAFNNARRAKINNINVDLIYGLPGQTVESLLRTLDYVTRLNPEHISFYNLKIEEGTPFWKMRDSLNLPDEDTEWEMYITAIRYLAGRGYNQYEISNFSKPGYQCKHNIKYWNCDEYLGFGPAAHSFFNGNRFSFCRNAEKYMSAMERPEARIRITDSMEEIMPKERLGEYVMLRFRLNEGISTGEFFRRFGKNFEAMFGMKLKRFMDLGYVLHRGDRYFLSPQGMFISNYILSDILDFSDVGIYDPMN